MRIVVTSSGADLDAPASPVFGRCPTYVFVDTETMAYEAAQNPAVGAASGAGIHAAQFVVDRGAQAVVTGNVGPNALHVLQSAGVTVYPFGGGTVRQAVEAFRTGRLQSVIDATAEAGQGLRSGTAFGAGALPASTRQLGMGMGRGIGRDMGRGMGRGLGMGRGMGIGRGMNAGPTTPPPTRAPQDQPSRSEEIAALKEMARQLESQLSQVMKRLDQLQE